MRTRWLAFLGCALISLPTTSAKAQTESPINAARIQLEAVPAFSGEPTLTASASNATALRGGPQELWTAQDAIPKFDANAFDSENDTPVGAPDKANCRWSFGVSNDWTCKIKPLTRYDFPIHGVVHYLWPLHVKSDNR